MTMLAVMQQAVDIGELIFHHTGDGHDIELQPFGIIQLPRWAPVHIGSWTIDLSPTRHVVLIILAAIITLVLLQTTAIGVKRARKAGRAPRGYTAAMEAFVLWARQDLAIENIGPEKGPYYASFVMSFFFFILIANFLGLLPWSSTPSGDVAFTGALAIVAFCVFEIGGMYRLGFRGYMKTLFPPIEGLPRPAAIGMSIFMMPIEFMSKLVKPFALTVRLFGNMTAGHFVILAMFGIVFMFGNLGDIARYSIGGVTALMVVGVMVLELVVGAIQAYIFALLTAVFIGLMLHDEH